MQILNTLVDRGLRAGVVWASGVRVEESNSELQSKISALLETRKVQEFPGPELKKAVRDLLRTGGYKPAGRNKPASEYLAAACRNDKFPIINNLVDINNYLSLHSGLPISMLDLAKTGTELILRFGGDGERYVFNSVGHEIDIKGLISICSGANGASRALGNPVKDSMAGKLTEETESVVAVVYAPATAVTKTQLSELMDSFAEMLRELAYAQSVEIQYV
ncbi:MAG: phenylalanine--tRNA ligase beta subunit-related protein [Planctomycetota bacterium]|nr:phenylalanine--tRNA ligase beta subunit-related protein [Planctomycetota bacterium]